MKKFLDKHTEKVTGTISCFDRLIFKGYLPLAWPDAMEKLMAHNGLKIKDFKRFVSSSSERLKNHAKALAERNGRSYRHLQRPARKEDLAREISEREKITEGLVCVLSAVESCQSFAVVPGKGRPQIVNAGRKCLCVYYYFLDRELGFLHVRIQTWFPFTVQIYLNGHDWLARKLEQHGIAFGRNYRGFNPAAAEEVALFKSVLRGEHVIQGFRNADIRHRLFKETEDGRERRRQSACVSRLFKRLHVHGLIAKIPRSRRPWVSRKGLRIMGAALEFYDAGFFDARQKICDHLRKSA